MAGEWELKNNTRIVRLVTPGERIVRERSHLLCVESLAVEKRAYLKVRRRIVWLNVKKIMNFFATLSFEGVTFKVSLISESNLV